VINALDNIDIIEASNIQVISIEVTEKINSKYLKQFLKTTLESNNINIDSNIYITHTFIQHLNLYEIYILKSSNENFITEIDILYKYYSINNTNNTTDLFITNNFFVIYRNKKLFTFKYFNKQSTLNDITLYIKQIYKIRLDNIYTIANNEFNDLKQLSIDDKSYININSFHKINTNNISLLFFIYLFISTILFGSFLYNIYINRYTKLNHQLQNIQTKYKTLSLQHNNKSKYISSISLKIINLFKYLKLKHIKLQFLIYEKKKIKATLLHKNQKNLLNILTIYNREIKINNIDYIKDKSIYKMEVEIEI
jgi:hypothetical protein